MLFHSATYLLIFLPFVFSVYFLLRKFTKDDGKYFMSLFSPNECSWGKDGYIGTFRLNYDNRWDIVDLT